MTDFDPLVEIVPDDKTTVQLPDMPIRTDEGLVRDIEIRAKAGTWAIEGAGWDVELLPGEMIRLSHTQMGWTPSDE